MAKSEFLNGTTVTSGWLNSILGGGSRYSWAASTAYVLGDIVKPTTPNSHVYRCIDAGTSAASEPTWPTTEAGEVTDSGVIWQEFTGHKHDGLAGDGSSGKVLLTSAAEVSGLLPWANIDGYAEEYDTSPTIAALPTSSPTIQNDRLLLQKLNGGLIALMFKAQVTPAADINYLTVELPSAYRPNGTYFHDNYAAPVSCMRYTGSVYENVAGIHSIVHRDSGTDYLYIGNHELVMVQEPTNAAFIDVGTDWYMICANMVYPAYRS